MMGFDPMSLEYIRVAHDDGLGVGDPRDIEIVGDDISQRELGLLGRRQRREQGGRRDVVRAAEEVPEGCSSTRRSSTCSSWAARLYHDYYRWPLKDKKTFEDWQANTPWGQLFEKYGRGEAGPSMEPMGTAASAT